MSATECQETCDHSGGVMVRKRAIYCGTCGHKRMSPRSWFNSSPTMRLGSCRPMLVVGDQWIFSDSGFLNVNFDFINGTVEAFRRSSLAVEELSRSITAQMKAEFMVSSKQARSIITNITA